MAALVEFIPIKQVRPECFSPRLRRAEYLVRKNRRRHRQFDPASGREASKSGPGVLPVDAGPRCRGVGAPVDAEGVEHRVDEWLIFSISVNCGCGLKRVVAPTLSAR